MSEAACPLPDAPPVWRESRVSAFTQEELGTELNLKNRRRDALLCTETESGGSRTSVSYLEFSLDTSCIRPASPLGPLPSLLRLTRETSYSDLLPRTFSVATSTPSEAPAAIEGQSTISLFPGLGPVEDQIPQNTVQKWDQVPTQLETVTQAKSPLQKER